MASWTTHSGEQVGVGDLVALNTLLYANAVGRIIAPAENGGIHCVVVRGGRPGSVVTVDADQLLLKVYR